MATAGEPALAPTPETAPPAAWHPATRAAFRLAVVYFGLYVLLTQMLTSLLFVTTNDSGAFELDMTRPAQAVVAWIAAHIFRVGHALVMVETGSGDRLYDWVELAAIAFLAVLGALVWTRLDRKRRSYPALFRWAHLIARFALAATLLTYGAFKVFPLQMPYPSLLRLLEPYGHFSPMGVLWTSIGAAPAYEIFVGSAELAGGILLLFPRTALLGALLGLADGIEVFTLNMTYDVPVKLLSFHIILLALFVLAPDARRLCRCVLFNRATAPAPDRQLFRTRGANRAALAVQVVFALYLIGGNLYGAAATMAARPAPPPLYGIWQVENFTRDGVVHPPLLTDTIRWRRLIFDPQYPGFAIVQDMAETNHFYTATVNMAAHTLVLTHPNDKRWQAAFTLTQPAPGHLALAGAMDGHPIQASLQLLDRSSLQLVGRGFHWVQDHPFNR